MPKVVNFDSRLSVRISNCDLSRLHRLAKSRGMKLSNFLRALPDMYPPKTEAA